KLGALIFQRALAEIRANPEGAGKKLDELARDPAFDVENRWQAEFQLARTLQLQGDPGVKEAFARVNLLLREPASGTAALDPELRARIDWLQVWLAFDNGEYEDTIRLAEALLKAQRDVAEGLKDEIASSVTLLKA